MLQLIQNREAGLIQEKRALTASQTALSSIHCLRESESCQLCIVWISTKRRSRIRKEKLDKRRSSCLLFSLQLSFYFRILKVQPAENYFAAGTFCFPVKTLRLKIVRNGITLACFSAPNRKQFCCYGDHDSFLLLLVTCQTGLAAISPPTINFL